MAECITADGKPMAAEAFVAAIALKVARLEGFPLLGRSGRFDDTRELIVHRNYLVSYRLRADEVQVLQLWHLARERRG